MTGYMNPDGSALIGGLNPSGVGQALQLDSSGNLKVTDSGGAGAGAVTASAGAFADGAITTIGTEADAAWALAGNATVIALLKKLDLLLQFLGYDNTNELKTSLYGKGNGAAGDTAVLLDSSGRPVVNINSLPSLPAGGNLIGGINIAQVLGSALSASNPLFVAQAQNGAVLSDINPEVNISNIQQMILNGKGFSCSTGQPSTAANMAASFFVPNTSVKNVLIWSVRLQYSNASQITAFQYLSTDDSNITAGTSVAGNVVNLKAGGPASSSGFAMHYNGGVAAAAGTVLDTILNPTNQTVELLSAGMFILIPAGQAGGIGVYTGTTTAGKWTVTVRWSEF